MAKRDELVGRPNQPAPADLEDERQISDVASRRFTPDAKGVASAHAPPRNAGHSYNPQDPYQYQKVKK